MHFSGDVTCELLEDGACLTVRLTSDVRFFDHDGTVWLAPAGLITDGASIPRLLWTLVGAPLDGRYRRAAVMHDAAYAAQMRPKREADAMFWRAMRCDGVGLWTADLLHTAVRWFGAWAWRADREKRMRSKDREHFIDAK